MGAQQMRDKFWEYFDEYLYEHGNEFYVTHTHGKSGENQAAGNINNLSPMARKTICCEIKYVENIILVQVYLNRYNELYNKLYQIKEKLESELGYSVEWIDSGKLSNTVRRIQKVFPINKPLNKMVEEVYPYILDFIRVFSCYL